MTPFTVNDRHVRQDEFNRAALDPSRSIVVEACAGSGKTWLLVARILRLLLAGARPSEILAITFTRKAAQEMRERLLALLEECATGEDGAVAALLMQRGMDERAAQAALPAARGLLERVLTATVPITIDTFHGWFARIVRNAPLLSGVPASFTLSDRSGELMRDARNLFLERIGSDAELRGHYMALLHMAGDANAWKILLAILDKRNAWQAFSGGRAIDEILDDLARQTGFAGGLGDAAGDDPRVLLLRAGDFAARYLAVARIVGSGSPTEAQRAGKAVEAFERSQGQRDRSSQPFREITEEDFKSVQSLVTTLSSGEPRKMTKALTAAAADFPGGAEGFALELAALSDALSDAAARAIERGVLTLNRAALHCGAALIEAYIATKNSRMTLDFDDLEWHAARLTADDSAAAYIQTRLDARYRHLLIDEFQDTNPLQWAVLRRWLEAYGADSARPSLFLVGDPKQSIYRFRRADPRLFDEARAMLHACYGADVLRTDQTRRCARAIVAALNATFLNGEYGLYAEHATVSPAEGQVWRLPSVSGDAKTAGTETPDASGGRGTSRNSLRDVLTTPAQEQENLQRDEEARRIAAVLRRLVGAMEIDAEENGRIVRRVAQFRDVLILVRRRRNILALERALRAVGLPYSSDRGGGLLETLEASDLGALLTFLVVPFSDLTLAHVLRTPIFGCTDDDLIALAGMEGATWWVRLRACAGASSTGSARLADAGAQLQRWLDWAGVLPVHDLLDRIYHDGRVLERYVRAVPAAQRAQVRANLLAYMELALQLDSGRYPSLPRFIAELETLARAADQEAPDEGRTDHGNTIRILTIHGAKGLEAPIVVLTDACAASDKTDNFTTLIDWPPGADTPRHYSVHAALGTRGRGRAAIFQDEARQAVREDWNLFYVAATRARDLLLVSGVVPGKSSVLPSWYDRIAHVPEWPQAQDWQGEQHEEADDEEAPGRAVQAPDRPGAGETVRIEDFRPAWRGIGQRAGHAAQAGERQLSLAHSSTQPGTEGVEEAEGVERTFARRRGIALHRLLEHARQLMPHLQAEAAYDRIARALLNDSGLNAAQRDEASAMARRILQAPGLQRFFDASQHTQARNEVEVLTDSGELMRIDRLVEFEDEIWILDYKSQTVSPDREPDAAYRQQLQRYRDTLTHVYPGRRLRTALIHADGMLTEI